MSTPTDPYSRRDGEFSENDDILDPLPEGDEPKSEEVSSAPEDSQAAGDAPAGADRKLPTEPDGLEATGAWRPDFARDEQATAEPEKSEPPAVNYADTDRDRWQSAFDSSEKSGTSPADGRDDATVVNEAAAGDEPTQITGSPVPGSASSGADANLSGRAEGAPQRTSIFDRPTSRTQAVSAESAPAPAAATPAATSQYTPATQAPVAPAPAPRRRVEPIPEEPHGRGWGHFGVFIATLVLAPFAWYLVADAGIRLTQLPDAQWSTTSLDWMAILEFLGALLCVGVLWFLASYSSVGSITIGLILLIGGLVPIFAPGLAQDVLGSSAMQSFASFNDFTGNVGHHLANYDWANGTVAVFGLALLMTGVVSHNARRAGADRGAILGKRDVLMRGGDR